MVSKNQETVEKAIEELIEMDISKSLTNLTKDQDWESTLIGEYSINDFHNYLLRVIKQLKAEAENGGLNVLPWQFNSGSEYGNSNLTNDFNLIKSFLEGPGLVNPGMQNASQALSRLMLYQVSYGFWDKGTKNYYDPDSLFLDKLKNDLTLIKDQLDQLSWDNETLKNSLQEEKESLETFRKQKEKELTQITQNLETSNTENRQLHELLQQATAAKTKVDGLKGDAEKTAKDITSLKTSESQSLKKHSGEVEEIKKQWDDLMKEGKDKNDEFTDHLKTVRETKGEFDERLAQLNELLGKESASQLFHTFNQRKNELKKPVQTWQWIVIGTGIAVLILTIAIFTNFFGLVDGGMPDTLDWPFLVVNSLKMVPALILFYFTIRQYTKERAFQEEYAFRSAVALTVQSYADLIAGDQGQQIKNQLIADAVKDVYRSPKPMSWEGGNLFSLKSRDLVEAIKTLTETVKEMKK